MSGNAVNQDRTKDEIRIHFKGNRNFSSNKLLTVIRDSLFYSKDIDIETRSADASQDLVYFYRDNGFLDVKVSYEVKTVPAREVVFTIHEGRAVSLGKIIFKGVTRSEQREMERLLHLPVGKVLGLNVGKKRVSPFAVQAWKADMESYLKEKGYLDARVEKLEIKRRNNGETGDIEVAVRKGPRYRLLGLIIKGKKKSIGKELLDYMNTFIGKPVSPYLGFHLKSRILYELENRGRIGPHVEARTRKIPEEKGVIIYIDVEPGPIAHIENIEISGLERTKESFVRERLCFKKGDVFRRRDIEKSITRLYATGLFELVSKEVLPLDDGKKAVVKIKVKEVPSRDLWVLFGAGSYEGPRIGAGFSDRNVFGLGKIFGMEGKASLRILKAGSHYTIPDFLSVNQSLNLSANAFTHRRRSFTEESYGLGVVLTRMAGENLKVETGAGIQKVLERNPKGLVEEFSGRPRIGYLKARVFLDARNNILNPTKGYLLESGLEVASKYFGGNTNFCRVDFIGIWVLPLLDGWRIASKAETDIVFPWGPTDFVPLSRRVYGGGESSVRSFKQDMLGPLDRSGNPLGGEYGNFFSIELRFPVKGKLEGAFFWDTGNVGRDAGKWTLKHMKDGLGTGIRYLLPIGPLRLDWAWNPRKRKHEDRWVLQFSIGFPF